jgi:hypothetical protein
MKVRSSAFPHPDTVPPKQFICVTCPVWGFWYLNQAAEEQIIGSLRICTVPSDNEPCACAEIASTQHAIAASAAARTSFARSVVGLVRWVGCVRVKVTAFETKISLDTSAFFDIANHPFGGRICRHCESRGLKFKYSGPVDFRGK